MGRSKSGGSKDAQATPGAQTRRDAQALRADAAEAAQGGGRQRSATAATDEKRDRILAVAARLFFEHGYANTTIASIATELGATKPFVYYYFRDKLALLETLSWRPTELALSAMDFDAGDARPAHLKLAEGLRRLIRVTIDHHPAATLPYREMQVYSDVYRAAHQRLADRFYARMTALLVQARRDGTVDCDDVKLTALAAASIPGFLYTWYRPDGRLAPQAVAEQLTRVALRAIGMRRRRAVPGAGRAAASTGRAAASTGRTAAPRRVNAGRRVVV